MKGPLMNGSLLGGQGAALLSPLGAKVTAKVCGAQFRIPPPTRKLEISSQQASPYLLKVLTPLSGPTYG